MRRLGVHRALIVLVLAAAGCAVQTSGVAVLEVTLVQVSNVPDIRVNVVGGLPMEYRLNIANPFEYPVTLVMVEVESVGDSGAYGMKRVRHAFNRTIAAKSHDAVDFRAWVYPLQADTRGSINNPVMLRGSAQFQGPAGLMRRNFVSRAQ